MIICGTGHRPNKLGGYGDEVYIRLVKTAEWGLASMPNRPEAVISGMALGWDQALANAALNINIPLWAYVPFEGQESMWPRKSKDAFYRLSDESEKKVICSEGDYAPWKMQVRNERMVDDSDEVLALWDGSGGGTGNCVQYARKKNKNIVNLWDYFQSL